MFTATVEGADDLARNWGSAVNLIRGGASQAVIRGVREGAQEAKTKHRFTNRSGDLERSIEGTVLGWDGDTCKGTIVAKSKYASFVEEGRGPVVAKAGGMLRFQIGGQVFFRKSVKAAAARPFMGMAYTKCEAVILREIEVGIASAQSILNR